MRHNAFSLALTLTALPCHAAGATVAGAHGITATIDEQSGRYEVRSTEPDWVFAGTLGGAASDLSVQDGQDAAVIRFPRFTEIPRDLHGFSYMNREFAPPSSALEENATPWLLYDEQAHAAVLSPAANYMIASMRGDGNTEIASGLNEAVAALPADFTHRTLMALGVGVNATWESWGRALTGLQGAQRPGNDADIGLRYLGYWTESVSPSPEPLHEEPAGDSVRQAIVSLQSR